ncbi:thrombospondin-related anonymous protein-like [Pocillopora verrucosa]|uniref:thrombospondin-related anonymous protein-like n=1 Tax=Pocillopora verrucosa TaxID=203993 RepID=UPI00333F33C8
MARKIVGAALILVVLCVSGEVGANLCSKKLDIIIAADVSGSMDDNQFTQLQTFLSTLVDNIKISKTSGARVIVLAFDDRINSLASSFSDKVTTSRSGIKTQINGLQFTAGSTVIDTVIEEAKDLLSSANRDTAQKVVVFVTDGVNFNGTDSLVLPAQELRDTFNARVIGLGIGEANSINIPGLRILAGQNDRVLILTFEPSSGGKCCDDDEDDDDDDRKRRRRDEDDECDDRRRRRRRDEDDGGCSSGVSNELKNVIKLICYG